MTKPARPWCHSECQAQWDGKVPTILLDDIQWPAPQLGWKQLRKVRDAIYEITDALTVEAPSDENPELKVKVISGEKYVELPEDLYEKVGEVVYHALTRAHPELTPEEFGNMAFSDVELLRAFLTVRLQSGLYVITDRSQGESPPGEAVGGVGTSISTEHSGG